MLKQIKGSSSRWLNKTKQLQPLFSWQRGYGAFSVSESACDRVRHYIRKQEEHHRKMAFTEEFVLMLEKHHIDYDERYLWD